MKVFSVRYCNKPDILPCIILTFLFFLLAKHSVAQHFNGGLFAGLITSQISGDRLGGFDKPGLYGGAFVSYNIQEDQTLQMELSFIQKGSRKTPNVDINDFTSYLLNMNYLEIPLWFQYKPIDRIGFEAGLSWAYLLSYIEEDHNGDLPKPAGSPEFKKTDVSSCLGIFYQMNPSLRIRLRMSHSILAVRDHASGAVYRLNRGQYHHLLSFSIQYQINKSK